jgi:glycosyltransferase involved in cell wall biosynthesis
MSAGMRSTATDPSHADATPPELSWVLPLYRTAAQLEELLARIGAVSRRLAVRSEIVLVDDACPEGCGAQAERIAMRDPDVHVVRHACNQGQDAALRTGLRRSRGRWCVLLDADLQDPPEAVERLWSLREDWDIVFAQRTGRYSSRGRRLGSRLYRAAAALVGGLPHGACLYVLLSRDVVQRINLAQRPRLSLLALIAATRGRSVCVAIQRDRRRIGVSAYRSRDRWAKAVGSLWQLFAARRLHRVL